MSTHTPTVDPSRRSVLAGVALSPLLAAEAHAGPTVRTALGGTPPGVSRLGRQAATLRERWARGAEELSATMLVDPGPGTDSALVADADALRQGFAAVEIFKELESMPLEDQVQGPMQRLMSDVLVSVGRAVRTSTRWAHSWADGEGRHSDPDEHHLQGALGALRVGLRGANTTHGRQQQLITTLSEALSDKSPGALRRLVRRHVRRAHRAENLADRIAESPNSTGVLHLDDPMVQARVQTALASSDEPDTLAGAEPEDDEHWALKTLASIALGVVIAGGVFITVLGLCAVSCSGASGIVILLLGIGLIGLGVWGVIRVVRGPSTHQAAVGELPDQALQPKALRSAGWADVDASKGWISAGVDIHPDTPVVARAWGVVRGGRMWASDAEGDGVAAGRGAPLPGAPARALIGRVGQRVFFIGAEQRVPADVSGPLELCANVSPDRHGRLFGGFTVQLLTPQVPA